MNVPTQGQYGQLEARKLQVGEVKECTDHPPVLCHNSRAHLAHRGSRGNVCLAWLDSSIGKALRNSTFHDDCVSLGILITWPLVIDTRIDHGRLH